MDSPYNYCQYRIRDAADALIFLERWWNEGYEYVQGLPNFGVGGQPARHDKDTIVSVLFKRRKK